MVSLGGLQPRVDVAAHLEDVILLELLVKEGDEVLEGVFVGGDDSCVARVIELDTGEDPGSDVVASGLRHVEGDPDGVLGGVLVVVRLLQLPELDLSLPLVIRLIE